MGNEEQNHASCQTNISGGAFQEIYERVVAKIKESENGYYLSWWIRLDFDNKYSTTKINYELSKAVKQGLLISKSTKYAIEYRLPYHYPQPKITTPKNTEFKNETKWDYKI